MKRQLVAILYADVVGFSRMIGEDEEGTYKKLRTALNLLTSYIESADGRKINEAGDAILAEFPSVISAIRAATEFQHALKHQKGLKPGEESIEFRIGVNLGEVIHDRGDIFGDGVNVAARIQELSKPGGVTITAAVYEQVASRLPLKTLDLGKRQLKNIQRPIQVFQLLSNDIEVEEDQHPVAFLANTSDEDILLDFDGNSLREVEVITGGCLCGWVRYEVTGKPKGTGICHCRICQRALGAPVNAWIVFHQDDVKFIDNGPQYFNSSAIAERSFCPKCGTSISYQLKKPDESPYLVFCLPTLDKPADHQPSWHGGMESDLDWMPISDNLPRLETTASPALRKAWASAGVSDPQNWKPLTLSDSD